MNIIEIPDVKASETLRGLKHVFTANSANTFGNEMKSIARAKIDQLQNGSIFRTAFF
jgi:hypothetical protein